MKKLMIAMAIAGAVGFAQATLTDPVTFSEQEYTLGASIRITPNPGNEVWEAAAADLDEDYYVTSTMVTNNDPNAVGNYLALDGVEKLERFAQAGKTAVDIGNGFYIDTLVKFTAAEEEPQTTTGDKICIWLKSNELDPTQCKLMVTAGYVNDEFAGDIVPTNYETSVTIADGSWQRLRVKVLKAIDSEDPDTGYLGDGFVIFVGDSPMTTVTTATCPITDEYTGELNYRVRRYFVEGAYAIFPSMIAQNGGGDGEITSLAFSGSGAVDEISFSQGNDIDPIIIAAEDMPVGKQLTYIENTEQTGVEGNLEGDAYEFGGTIAATEIGNYTATATLMPGYAWTDGGFYVTNINWSIVASTPGWVNPSDPSAMAEIVNKPVSEVYASVATAVPALANADAGLLTVWATGTGNVNFNDASTINVECYLLNIPNNSTAETIEAAEDVAEEAIKITAITFDENGDPVISSAATYGNGVVVVEGSIGISPASWHDKTDGDYFFRTVLRIKEGTATPSENP